MKKSNKLLIYLLSSMVAISCSDDHRVLQSRTPKVPEPEQVPTRPYINKDRTYYLALVASGDGSQWKEDVASALQPLLRTDFELESAWAPLTPERCIRDEQGGLILGGVVVVDLTHRNDMIENLGFKQDYPYPALRHLCTSINSLHFAFRDPVPQKLPDRQEVILSCNSVLCPDSIANVDKLYYLGWDMWYATQDQRMKACESVLMDLVESGVDLERVWMPMYQTGCDLGGSAATAMVVEVPEPDAFLLDNEFVDGPTNLLTWNCLIEDYWFYCFDPCKQLRNPETWR